MGCVQRRWLAGCCVASGDQATLYSTLLLPDTVTSDPSNSGRCLGGVLIPSTSMPPVSPRLISSARDLPRNSRQEIKPFGPQFPILRVMPARACFSTSVIGDVTFLDVSWTPAFHQPVCLHAYTPLLGDSDNSVCTVWWCQSCGEAERRILIMKWGRQLLLSMFSVFRSDRISSVYIVGCWL